MKKLLALLFVTISAINSFAQKPDYIRTPNGPNTIVDWNLKAKTFVLPHGATLGLFGSQDTTGNVRFIVAPGDTSLNIRVGGLKWWNPVSNFFTKTQSDARYAPVAPGGGYVPYSSANDNVILNPYNITAVRHFIPAGHVTYGALELVPQQRIDTLLAGKSNLSGGNTFTGTQNIWDGSTYGLTLGYSGTFGAIWAKDIVTKTTNNAALKVYGDGSTVLQGSTNGLYFDIAGSNKIALNNSSGLQIDAPVRLYNTPLGTVGKPILVLSSGVIDTIPGNSYQDTIVATIADLQAYAGRLRAVHVSDKYQGGLFRWSTVGIISNVTSSSLTTPTTPMLTGSSSGGVIPSGTYYYVITALKSSGTETLASPEASVTLTGSTSSVGVAWTAVSGASGYRVYVGTRSGQYTKYFDSATNSFTDVGGYGIVDGGIVFTADGIGSGYWIRQYSGNINSWWFKGYGDGVHIVTKYLQNAINYVATHGGAGSGKGNGGGTLYSPSGTYLINPDSLNLSYNNITFEWIGDGQFATILSGTGSGVRFKTQLINSNTARLSIKHMTFGGDGGLSPSGTGIYLGGVTNGVFIEDVSFSGLNTGIQLEDTYTGSFKDLFFINYITGITGTSGHSANNNQFLNCNFGDGKNILPAVAVPINSFNMGYNLFQECRFEGSGYIAGVDMRGGSGYDSFINCRWESLSNRTANWLTVGNNQKFYNCTFWPSPSVNNTGSAFYYISIGETYYGKGNEFKDVTLDSNYGTNIVQLNVGAVKNTISFAVPPASDPMTNVYAPVQDVSLGDNIVEWPGGGKQRTSGTGVSDAWGGGPVSQYITDSYGMSTFTLDGLVKSAGPGGTGANGIGPKQDGNVWNLNTPTGNKKAYYTFSATSTYTYIFSVWVLPKTAGDSVRLSLSNSLTPTWKTVILPSTSIWQRIFITVKAASTANLYAQISTNGATGIYISSPQLEEWGPTTSRLGPAGYVATTTATGGQNYSNSQSVSEFSKHNMPGLAPPTIGTYTQGDYVWNLSVATGQPKGWVCTVSGTPGTWIVDGTPAGTAVNNTTTLQSSSNFNISDIGRIGKTGSVGTTSQTGVWTIGMDATTGTPTNQYGLYINRGASAASTATNVYGIRINSLDYATATTNAYGLYIGEAFATTLKYGIYQSSPNNPNVLFGNTQIGSSTPTAGAEKLQVTGTASISSTLLLGNFTVATLPAAGTKGRIAYVTDALTPTFLGVLVGGGAVGTLASDNGTNWVAQ